MLKPIAYGLLLCCTFAAIGSVAQAQLAGTRDGNALLIAADKKSTAYVVVSPEAGVTEKRAAADLATYIEKMTGAAPTLADTTESVAAAMKDQKAPVLVVGQAAIAADPALSDTLRKAAKPNPHLRSDAILIKRAGNRVYIAGNNDEAHYYAVSELLQRWGCRWYLPTEFGECIPHHAALEVGDINFVYGCPFEIRRYWLAWAGSNVGQQEFTRRNYMNHLVIPNGHALGNYVRELVPQGKTLFNVPIADEKTAQHIATKLEEKYAAGGMIRLGLDDGVYESDSPADKELIALQYDKYFLTQSYTDAFMKMYNRIAELLMQKYPKSKAKIGFLAYSNVTMPPVLPTVAKSSLYAYLAPIDFDPIHGMDDPKGGHRREYREMMYKWAKVMEGRLAIYDYDQTMLVWRDLPNPSHQAFRQDVKHYRKAGILGVDTESRGATATVFLNLYMRGQLLWNPDFDVDAALAEFYPKFYGPAAKPMSKYWSAINHAWENSIVSEHEYFVAPAIYTPALRKELEIHLQAAEALVKEMAADATDAQLIRERMKFTRTSFDIINGYLSMVKAANSEIDYKTAVEHGERALAVRRTLTEMNPTFTSTRLESNGSSWWNGEVQQYRDLAAMMNGTDGQLIVRLPLEWAFRRDPTNIGLKEGWQKQVADLSYWKGLKPASLDQEGLWQAHRSNPGEWEMMRSDLYLQAQGLVTKDYLSYTGFAWYQTDVELTAEQVRDRVHLLFPGVFNECWLYLNGEEVAHRPFKGVWWRNNYKFEWDVDLAGKLKPGKNNIVLRINNPHHFGGMFRRPFLYQVVGDPVAKAAEKAKAKADARAAAAAKAKAKAGAKKRSRKPQKQSKPD